MIQASYYRNHAARARELAAETLAPGIKEHLHDVARQYDVLAERSDEAARVRGRSP